MSFESIYLWSDPIASGCIFATVLVVLVSLCYYSLISVVANTALFLLATVAGFKVYVYVMNTFLKKNVTDYVQRYAGMDMSLSHDNVSSLATQLTDKANSLIQDLRKLFLIDNMLDSIKFGCSLWLLTYIGSWFNAMTLLILAWVALFTIPKIYLNNKEAIDPVLAKIKAQLDEVKVKVGAFLPQSKAAAEVETKKEE